MPRIRFTENLQRHVACPPGEVAGGTVREVLEAYFAEGNRSTARGYVLDDQGALRKHMAIFVNGAPVMDRRLLADAVPEDGTVDVIQALSGG
ncbi:MAG: MoaD/ThiS family protein [Verrucomicrobiae bacterium]|nr:MoaD/ThiS family protein [Verrucomicrobiae bacterium]